VSEAQVGVDEYHAEILPEDKARFVEEERAKGHTVIMLGNGINDSPALLHNLSTLGISLRSMTNLLGTAPDPKN
jgi:P-type E1-E2 ATPase